MKLEDQLTSLDLSRRLKELGVEQESLWYWREIPGQALHCDIYWPARENMLPYISAYSVAELGEMLPIYIEQDDKAFELETVKDSYGWSIGYLNKWSVLNRLHEVNEADARAKMLIHLLESGLIQNTKEGK